MSWFNCENGKDIGLCAFETKDEAICHAENDPRVMEIWEYAEDDDGYIGDAIKCIWTAKDWNGFEMEESK